MPGRRTKLGIPYCTEYNIWRMMWERCLDPENQRYKDYGGRGISVCERWRDLFVFVQDMGRRPSKEFSLDRKNNDGNYEPDNCRWATRIEQAQNCRHTRKITIDGKTMSLRWWCRHYGIDRDTALRRYAVHKDWQVAFEMDGRLPRSNSFKVTINGITRTIKEWSKLHGVEMKIIWQRICRDGMNPELAVMKSPLGSADKKNVVRITLHGVTKGLNTWCKLCKIPRTTAKRRYKRLGDWAKVFPMAEAALKQAR